MISAGQLLRAPVLWRITMKPTGHCRGAKKKQPELTVEALGTKEEAVSQARETAAASGFSGYAITKIIEVRDG